ncbi:heterokaryon incompatibility protein-domain-containing protein [Hypoxylon sp. FL1857]|nr:heterokaryon incompatibility protein-domain-containing protein [Hypoxylon sp. FL1857]
MSPATVECTSERKELVEIDENCPRRPYVEIRVPDNAKTVLAVHFTTVSRDQGWATVDGPSYSSFWTHVERPGGRPEISFSGLQVCENRRANGEFHEQTHIWTNHSNGAHGSWVKALSAGDLIQLIPRAYYSCWVNIISAASLKIEFEPKEEAKNTALIRFHGDHYGQLGPREIRVLEFGPGCFEDPILGRFLYVNLPHTDDICSTEFHALSYCWGDPIDVVDIELSLHIDPDATRPFSVGRTVEQAVRRLRTRDKPLRIWIDAVCINQANLAERGQQVRMMGDIYTHAAFVHIWLGESNQFIDTAFRVTRDVFNFNTDCCPAGVKCHCPGTPHTFTADEIRAASKILKEGQCSYKGIEEVFHLHRRDFIDELLDTTDNQSTDAHSVKLFNKLFEHPWFSRVWVLQEALLARQAFIHCGDQMMPWEEVVAIHEWIGDAEYKLIPHYNRPATMPAIWARLGYKQKSRQRTSVDETSDVSATANGIMDIFLDALDLKSTLPQDKLFALLSFGSDTNQASELDPSLRANYEKPARQVFAEFTRWHIRSRRSLNILSAIHGQKSRTWVRRTCSKTVERPQLPTWAVDNNGRSRWTQMTLQAQFAFKAVGDTIPDETLLDPGSDLMVLRLRGIAFSEVEVLTHTPIKDIYPYDDDYQSFLDGRSDIKGVFDRMFNSCYFLEGDLYWKTHKTVSPAWSTVDKALAYYRAHMRTHWEYTERPAVEVLKLTKDSPDELTWYKTRAIPTCLDQCFFRTSNGSFGLCPWPTKEGDVVAFLFGAEVPYLLRPINDEQVNGNNISIQCKYELVGECYLDGFMDGEIFTSHGGSDLETTIFNII